MVARDAFWWRTLPPARLDRIEDDVASNDDERFGDRSRWKLCAARRSLEWEWALERGAQPFSACPTHSIVTRDVDGTGHRQVHAYAMPPRSPVDPWADITGAPCPVDGCGQTLVWWEAGFAPGFRVCMATAADGRYDTETILHRFALDHRGTLARLTTLLLVGNYSLRSMGSAK